MVIKKLNSLFHKHARVLFGIFAVIIIIAFMDFLTPGRGGGCSESNPDNIKVGTAFGETVTYGDLREQAQKTQIASQLGLPALGQDSEESLFQTICLLKRAEQLGVRVTENEVAAQVRRIFQKEGKFDLELYRKFLADRGLKDQDILDALRAGMTIQRLYALLQNGVSVSDHELETAYRIQFADYAVKVLEIPAADFAAQVKAPTEAAMRQQLAQNRVAYMIPGSVEALLIELPGTAFKQEAEKLVNAPEFLKQFGGKLEPDQKKALISGAQQQLAARRLGEFFRKLVQALEKGKTPTEKQAIFRKLASDGKYTVIESGKVNFGSAAIGGIASPELMRDLQSMPVNGTAPVTRPRATQKGAALALLLKRTEARVMTFDEAKTKLAADLRHAEALRLARTEAAKAAALLAKSAPEKRSAEFAKLKGKFTAFHCSPAAAAKLKADQQQLFSACYQQVPLLATGEISRPVDSENGAILVQLTGRTPADMAEFAKNKEAIRQTLQMQKFMQAGREFERVISRECRFDLLDRNPEK